MAEEVSSIGVKLSLNAGSFMSGMTAATEKTEQFVAAAKEAQTVAGKTQGSKSGPGSSGAQRSVAVPVDLTISSAQIRSIREQIIKGIGTISVPITAQLSKAAQNEAKAVMSAVSTPAVGTRSGARVAVESTVARNLPKREYGGSVQANRGVLVGERRPEVFVPRQSGSIHPDASRFYREQETAARREAAAERQHQERMGRIQHARFGLRSVTGSYPNAEVDLSQSSRRDRLRYGDELVSLARQYPHTAQRMKEIRSMPDRPFNLAVDRAYKQPAGTFPPMSTFGMTTGSRKTAPRMLLNASFTDQDVRSMGAVPRNIVEGLRHEYGHAVDFSNSVTQNAFLGPALGKLAPQSKYAKVGPREHFAELFTAYQRGALGGDDKTLFDAVKMIDQKRAGRHGGGYVHAMAGAKVGDIEERLTRVQRSYTANIRSAARRLTPDVTKAGIDWYPGAQDWIGQQALAFGKPEPMVRGMAAALSAGTSWPANKTKLLRILQADASGKPFPYSRALDAHVKAEKMLAGADPWSLLGHTPKTGQFFLNTGGDLDALTIDRWAFRTATRGAVEQQGSGRVRRGADKAFRKVAKEMGIHPVQLQAALWIQEKYDADLAVGKKPDIAKYMARGGAVEGTGEGLFHHHGARPQQGFLRGALSTAGEWLKDPFMAWQAWQGQQGHAAKGAGPVPTALSGRQGEAHQVGQVDPAMAATDSYSRVVPRVDAAGPDGTAAGRQSASGWTLDEQRPTGRAGRCAESLFELGLGARLGCSRVWPGLTCRLGSRPIRWRYLHAEKAQRSPQRLPAPKSAEAHVGLAWPTGSPTRSSHEDVPVAEAKRSG